MKHPTIGHAPWLLILFLAGPAFAQQATVPSEALMQQDGVWYRKGADEPFTGQVRDEGVWTGAVENGLPVGRWTGWHPDGTVQWVTDYEAGRRVYHAMWHPNGEKRYEGRFSEAGREGVHQMWNPTGQQTSMQTYVGGQRHGTSTFWDDAGHLRYTAEYANGAVHGPAIWYYANGQKRWETHYADGQRTGTWTQWNGNGAVLARSTWADGRLVKRTHF